MTFIEAQVSGLPVVTCGRPEMYEAVCRQITGGACQHRRRQGRQCGDTSHPIQSPTPPQHLGSRPCLGRWRFGIERSVRSFETALDHSGTRK